MSESIPSRDRPFCLRTVLPTELPERRGARSARRRGPANIGDIRATDRLVIVESKRPFRVEAEFSSGAMEPDFVADTDPARLQHFCV